MENEDEGMHMYFFQLLGLQRQIMYFRLTPFDEDALSKVKTGNYIVYRGIIPRQ